MVDQDRIVRAQTSIGVAPAANSLLQPSTGTGKKLAQHLERLRVGAAVIEHAEHPRAASARFSAGLEKRGDAIDLVVRDDLRQVEVGVGVGIQQEIHLARSDRRPDWPSRPTPVPGAAGESAGEAATRARATAAGRRACRRQGPPATENRYARPDRRTPGRTRSSAWW